VVLVAEGEYEVVESKDAVVPQGVGVAQAEGAVVEDVEEPGVAQKRS